MAQIRQKPVAQKDEKSDGDPWYRDQVRLLPCCVCEAFDMQQLSPTTLHHVIHDRFGTLRTPDRNAIPLCDGHHQGDRDTSKTAIHRGKVTWRGKYGPDHGFTAATQRKILGG